jgi:HD-GYP domain-containing protein (c-di-GMP phosphodiesterase class II)
VPDVVAAASASESAAVGMARALAVTAARREDATEAHAEQVAMLATRMAEHMALPVRVVERCTLAGWLHDVGKVAVPERILLKAGPLDDAELAVMRVHPVVGADIVGAVASLKDAAAGVRHHHERYDGTGYPDRLAGAAIPIEARIVAVADAFAAMTSDRVYSPAGTPLQAAAELRRSGGSQLDPAVVAVLLNVLDLGPALRAA